MSFTGKPQLTTNAPITNDGFWPDLVVGDLVEKYRVPSEYDDGVVATGLKVAMARVNKKLAGVKLAAVEPDPDCAASVAANVTAKISLLEWAEAYEPSMVDGELVAVFMYKHAVYSAAKAFLLRQFNSMEVYDDGYDLDEGMRKDEDYWLNQSQQGIGWLFGRVAPCLSASEDVGFYVALI
jgi:Phage head completion protein (GPL)